MNGERIRLHGIDAPELRQDCIDEEGQIYGCGQRAKLHLISLIEGKSVRCNGAERDKYGRRLATCYVGRTNLNKQMVADGWALAYVRYSDAYLEEQNKAQQAGIGIWQGRFIAPWKWR